MIKDIEKLAEEMVARARQLGDGCVKVFVATSGGVDSSLVAAILCRAFGPKNVVGLYRDIRSNPKHREDVFVLQKALGFTLIDFDANPLYDLILAEVKKQFQQLDLTWVDEESSNAKKSGFTNAYASLKSRLTTPLAGFISKAIDGGNGRIFGTGNGEEDGLLRYFDKYGDGAVDNNILNGLTKAEVRQLARYLGVPEQIILKKPSADLEANGDAHNDEGQLTQWAHSLGYEIDLSYGSADGSEEGNIAWAWKQDIEHSVITNGWSYSDLVDHGYTIDQINVILFIQEMERSTRHKVEPIPGLERERLRAFGFVD
jgi:NAD+ synthase